MDLATLMTRGSQLLTIVIVLICKSALLDPKIKLIEKLKIIACLAALCFIVFKL